MRNTILISFLSILLVLPLPVAPVKCDNCQCQGEGCECPYSGYCTGTANCNEMCDSKFMCQDTHACQGHSFCEETECPMRTCTCGELGCGVGWPNCNGEYCLEIGSTCPVEGGCVDRK